MLGDGGSSSLSQCPRKLAVTFCNSRTRSGQIPGLQEKNLTQLRYGDVIYLPGGALESPLDYFAGEFNGRKTPASRRARSQPLSPTAAAFAIRFTISG